MGYFIVWNPITGQLWKIFDPGEFRSVSNGFGYVSAVDDYKIVRIVEMPFLFEVIVHVFSLKSNIWKRIDDHNSYQNVFPLVDTPRSASRMLYLKPKTFMNYRGVLVDETLYWVAAETEVRGRRIVTFDLELEKFDEFPHLELRSTEFIYDVFLAVMGGSLCKVGFTASDDVCDEFITMWRGPGEKKTIHLIIMRLASCHDLVGFARTGKFFVIDKIVRKLGLVDPGFSPVKYTQLLLFGSQGLVDPDFSPVKYTPLLLFGSEGLVDPGFSPVKYTPLLPFERIIAMVNYVPSLISP